MPRGIADVGAFVAGLGYRQVCGRADAEGDGITPVETALMPGATHIVLEDVYHTPLGADDANGRCWYGSESVLASWAASPWGKVESSRRSSLVSPLVSFFKYTHTLYKVKSQRSSFVTPSVVSLLLLKNTRRPGARGSPRRAFSAGERASAPSAALTSTGRNPAPHPVASSGFPHSSSAWFRFTLCRPLCAHTKIFVVGQSDVERPQKCAFERKPRFGAPLASRLSPLASLARERRARTDEEFHASDNTAFESTRAPPTNILNVMSRARARGLERALERALDRFDRWTRPRRNETKRDEIDRSNRSIARGARRRPRDGLRRFPTASSSRARRADAVVEKRKPIRI